MRVSRPQQCWKQWLGNGCLEIIVGRLYAGTHHRPVERQEKDFLAVRTPPRRPAALSRDRHESFTNREWSHIDLVAARGVRVVRDPAPVRSEEHTSELQSRLHLVCRLLLEKKKKNT